jgi:hypothetical protein
MRRRIKRRANTPPSVQTDSLPIEDLLESLNTNSEQHFYEQVFTGKTNSVKAVWATVAERSEEDYWVYNCPFIRFCSRTIALNIPQTAEADDE